MKLLAEGTPLGTIGGGEGLGSINEKISNAPGDVVVDIISKVIGFMTIGGVIWFMIQILIAGLGWISAGGEKNKLTEARDRLTNAFIGLLVVVAAYAILSLAGQFLGWKEITTPEAIIENLTF